MTDDRITEMARAYVEEGLSYAQIGERYGVTRQRVGQLLGPLNIVRDRGQGKIVREQNLRAAHERLMAGATLDDEAEALGYGSAESLRSALYDLDLRVIRERPIPAHGTLARYRSRIHGCKCEECRRANRTRCGELKGEEPPRHGTYSGYINYACRCKACKEAYRVAVRMRRAANRRKKVVNV